MRGNDTSPPFFDWSGPATVVSDTDGALTTQQRSRQLIAFNHVIWGEASDLISSCTLGTVVRLRGNIRGWSNNGYVRRGSS